MFVDPNGTEYINPGLPDPYSPGNELAKLCTGQCVGKAGGGCNIEQCKKEAGEIGEAIRKMFFEKRTFEICRPLRTIFCGGSDYRAGWMCYQWQTFTWDAVKDLIAKSKCFSEQGLGMLARTVQHLSTTG